MRVCLILVLWLGLTQIVEAQTSRWQVERAVDPLTDEVRLGAVTAGNGTTAMFLCEVGQDSSAMRAFHVTTQHIDIEFGDTREVSWRVDSNDVTTSTWYNLDRGGAVTYGEEAVQIARQVRDANTRLVVRSGGRTVTYSVAGSTDAITQALEGCGID